MKTMRNTFRCIACLAAAAAAVGPARAEEPTPYEAIGQRIDLLRRALVDAQRPDGSWPPFGQEEKLPIPAGALPVPEGVAVKAPTGMTALAVCALARAGADPDGPSMRNAGRYLDKHNPATTTGRALRALAGAATVSVGAPGASTRLYQDMGWLLKAQRPDGGWGPDGQRMSGRPARNRGAGAPGSDPFHTSLALWALTQGAAVRPAKPFLPARRVVAYWRKRRNPDGAWASSEGGEGDLALTASVLANLRMLRSLTGPQRRAGRRAGTTRASGPKQDDDMLSPAVDWLGENWPDAAGRSESELFALVHLDRAGAAGGHARLAGVDWFLEQAQSLTANLDEPPATLVAGSLELMFLSAAMRVSLLGVLRTGPPGAGDVGAPAALTQLLGPDPKLGRPLGWRSVGIDDPIDVWHRAPLLLLTGNAPLVLDDAQIRRIKRYLDTGGTLAAAPDGSSDEFTDSVTSLAAKLYPGETFRRLAADHPGHPVLHGRWRISRSMDVQALGNGARDAIFLLPGDLTKAWRRPVINRYRRRFQVMGNLYLYATGNTLRGRAQPKSDLPRIDRSGRKHKTVAIVKHSGRFNPNPGAFAELSRYMVARFDVDVESAGPFAADDPLLLNYRLAWLTGDEDPKLSPAEMAGLQEFVTAGGTLAIDPHYGRHGFAEATRRTLRVLLPDARPMSLRRNHPIVTGKIAKWAASNLHDLALKPSGDADPDEPRIPSFTVLNSGDRVGVIFIPYDVTSGLAGDTAAGCLGFTIDSATRLAANIVLYADP